MKKALLFSCLLIIAINSIAQWEIITQNIDVGVRTDIEIAPDGMVYMAYMSFNGGAYHGMVKKYDGLAWQTVGSGSIYDINSYFRFDFEIDSEGNLYLAYVDDIAGQIKMTVKKFNGTSWEFVGEQGFSEGEIQFPQIDFDSNDVPFVVYRDFANGNNATVKKFNGSSWELVGDAGFTEAGAWCTSIIIDNNDIPYVSYMDWANGQKISVDRFVGGEWETVGSPGFSIAEAWTTNMGIDAGNIPYVVYNDQGDNDNTYLKKWNGNSWETVGGGSVSTDAGLDANFIFDNNNNVYVVFQDYSVSQAPASVKKLVGSNWEYLGEAGFPGTNCRYTSIAIDNEGSIFIAYVEMYNGQGLTVAQHPSVVSFMKEIQKPEVVIYPNPTNGIIKIITHHDEKVLHISLTDISGKLIFQSNEMDPTIDLSGYDKGIYFIQIETANGITTEKLIVR